MNTPALFALLVLLSPSVQAEELVFGPAEASRGQTLDMVIAVVDDEVITRRELDQAIVRAERQLRSRDATMPTREAIERQVLENLIRQTLIDRYSRERGIVVDDASLEAAIEAIARNNNVSLEQLRREVEASGINFTVYREEIRREVVMARLRQRLIDSQIEISEREIDGWLTGLAARQPQTRRIAAEYRVGHILIELPEGASPQQISAARQRSEAIIQRLRSGADFRAVALSESAAPTALDGGDLGWRRLDRLPTVFVDVVPGLSSGQISNPIRTPSGFHIITVFNSRGELTVARTVSADPSQASDAQRAEVREALFRRKVEENWESWLRRLRDDAYVETRL